MEKEVPTEPTTTKAEENTQPTKATDENTPKTDTENKAATESEIEALATSDKPKKPIPPELDKNYLIDGNQDKGRYYFKDKPDIEAFRDRGNKMTTKSTASSIAYSMVSLAESKNWESLKVTGDKNFRREVWLEAKSRGIEVSGYKPTEQDQKQLEERLEKINSVEKDAKPDSKESDSVGGKTNSTSVVDRTTVTATKAALAAANLADKKPEQAKERDAKEELRDSYLKLTKEDAIKKHPELEPLYNLEAAARQFVGHERTAGRFDEKGKERFIQGVRDKGLDTLASGKELKPIQQKAIHQPQRDQEAGKEEIAR
ncbi:LPD7 domain-containing protein [Gilvimarinus chinensis]|uniref:LPD7 domain-containing protein n=1 Tax=Gilvimarinus chinensis TaxID=396005 RepID=UPI000379E633|nr:LPD7 domain-containing protein [Gilvimarinus chinensis]